MKKWKIAGIIICAVLIIAIIVLLICNWTGKLGVKTKAYAAENNDVVIPQASAFLATTLPTLESAIFLFTTSDGYAAFIAPFQQSQIRIVMDINTPGAGNLYVFEHRIPLALSLSREFSLSYSGGSYYSNGSGSWDTQGPNNYEFTVRTSPSSTLLSNIRKWSGYTLEATRPDYEAGGGWFISLCQYSITDVLTVRVTCQSLKTEETDYFDIIIGGYAYIDLSGDEIGIGEFESVQTAKGALKANFTVVDMAQSDAVNTLKQIYMNNPGYQLGYDNGYQSGYDFGYEVGKTAGIEGGISSATPIQSAASIVKSVFGALDVKIFGVISIIDLVGIVVVIGLVGFILKLVR